MEVHTHSHTQRKKWTHYFWEFLMLFLAVFCGFFAENQREHLIENRKEIKYMRSLIEDSNINEGEEHVGFKDAITEFEEDISDDDDENANENLEERQIGRAHV